MRIITLVVASIAVACMPAYGLETKQEMPAAFVDIATQYKKIIEQQPWDTDFGTYHRKFLDEAVFVRQCAPSDARGEKPFTIYVVIKKDGHVGQMEIYPLTETAKCVAKLMQGHVFSAPSFDFLGEIVVNFNPVPGDAPVGGRFASPHVDAGQPPCRELVSVELTFRKDEDYRFYECGQETPQRFVLWRVGKNMRLEGELVLPAKLFKPYRGLVPGKAEPFYGVSIVNCVTRDDKNKHDYTSPASPWVDRHVWAF